MNKYIEYEQMLKDQISASVFALVIISALAVLVIVLNVKGHFGDLGKIGKIAVNVFVAVVVISSATYFTTWIYKLNNDIKNQAYVTYYGEFSVSNYKNSYVTIKRENNELVLSGWAELPGGEYIGKVVYSKESEYLLEYSVGAQ